MHPLSIIPRSMFLEDALFVLAVVWVAGQCAYALLSTWVRR